MSFCEAAIKELALNVMRGGKKKRPVSSGFGCKKVSPLLFYEWMEKKTHDKILLVTATDNIPTMKKS